MVTVRSIFLPFTTNKIERFGNRTVGCNKNRALSRSTVWHGTVGIPCRDQLCHNRPRARLRMHVIHGHCQRRVHMCRHLASSHSRSWLAFLLHGVLSLACPQPLHGVLPLSHVTISCSQLVLRLDESSRSSCCLRGYIMDQL